MDTETRPLISAGCYLRISSDPQDKREGVGRQREDTTALCELKGWQPTDFYVDNDRSASSGRERPEWDRLLADIKAGKIDAIAAWDQDRGWRMMHELETLRKFFTSLGRQIHLATTGQGDIDLYSPTGVLAAQIKTAVSEHEIAMMKVRQRRAARARADQGIPNWQKAFGYDENRQPHPVTAPLVRDAFASILAGGSISGITREWNEAGAFAVSAERPWTPSTVSKAVRRPLYAGLRSYLGEIVGPGNWPGLVTPETWKAAQGVLNAPSRTTRKTARRYLLTRMLWCGREGCDGYLAGLVSSRDKKIVYRCKRCLSLSVRGEFAEEIVYRLVGGRLAMPDAVDLLKAEIDEAEAEAIRNQLNELYSELEQIGVERGQRLLTGAQAKTATDVVQADIDALERKQQDAERVRVFRDVPLGKPEAVAAVRELSRDRFRAALDVIGKVTVAPQSKSGKNFNERRVTIQWWQ